MSTVPVLRALLRAALALPAPLARLRVGPPPVNDRGVALDEGVHRVVWLENRVFGGITKGTPAAARAGMRRSVAIVAARPTAPLDVRDTTADGVPVRVYRPPGGPRPVLVWLHGGGWVQGDLATHDALCRRLAAEADRVVLAADYRLAPEHPFPEGLDDTLAVLRWARTHAGELGA
ncbi:MAG: alpha/beta hydrolase, partial [Myxococcota bacterium]